MGSAMGKQGRISQIAAFSAIVSVLGVLAIYVALAVLGQTGRISGRTLLTSIAISFGLTFVINLLLNPPRPTPLAQRDVVAVV